MGNQLPCQNTKQKKKKKQNTITQNTPPLSKHNIALNQLPCQNTKQKTKETKYNYTKHKTLVKTQSCSQSTPFPPFHHHCCRPCYWYFDHNNILHNLNLPLKSSVVKTCVPSRIV